MYDSIAATAAVLLMVVLVAIALWDHYTRLYRERRYEKAEYPKLEKTRHILAIVVYIWFLMTVIGFAVMAVLKTLGE